MTSPSTDETSECHLHKQNQLFYKKINLYLEYKVKNFFYKIVLKMGVS